MIIFVSGIWTCFVVFPALNAACRAPLSEDGHRADFAAFVEWILARNGSRFTVCSEDDLASSTLDPEPSPPSPHCAELKPESTVDGETAVTDEPSPHGATELRIAAEPELFMTSDQVREPATTPAKTEKAMDRETAERSSAHCTMGEGELIVDLEPWNSEGEIVDLYADLPPLLPPSSEPSVSSVPKSCTERASVPEFSSERAPVLELGPERAPVPEFGPERAAVLEYSPDRARVPESNTDRASVPKFGPERASIPKIGPERASVPEFSPDRTPFPELGPERAPVPEFGPYTPFPPYLK